MCLLHVCHGFYTIAIEFTSTGTNLAAELATIYGRPAALDPVKGAKYKCAAAEWARHVETSQFFPHLYHAKPDTGATVTISDSRPTAFSHPSIVVVVIVVVATTYGKPPWPGRSL